MPVTPTPTPSETPTPNTALTPARETRRCVLILKRVACEGVSFKGFAISYYGYDYDYIYIGVNPLFKCAITKNIMHVPVTVQDQFDWYYSKDGKFNSLH